MSLVEANNISGSMFWRDDAGYEEARRGAVANGRKPDRFPDVIVRPRSDGDVVAAVRLAKKRSLKIGVRSGGHSWAASFLRDGGMLLDLSQMRGFSVDADAQTATVQPALKGSDFNRALLKNGLFFPSGHCRQHVDQRIGRCAASEHAQDCGDATASAVAHDVDAVGTDTAAPRHGFFDGV